MRTVTSELLRIPGVGEAKRRQLLEAFGSLHGVREAGPEAIAALPGFSEKSAQKILAALERRSPTAAVMSPDSAAVEPEPTTESS